MRDHGYGPLAYKRLGGYFKENCCWRDLNLDSGLPLANSKYNEHEANPVRSEMSLASGTLAFLHYPPYLVLHVPCILLLLVQTSDMSLKPVG
ncbi:hypothetical protein VNO77_27000 [Canavalia gladiata]|uniref:Uncharacterized protein n=1 Tax=Canavalia gladiata TaxID=3824 RepID=A0AAN9QA43_CANGL